MRLAFNIALIASLLYLPWWVGALLAIAACLCVDKFYEVVIYGVIADALYGTKFGFHGFRYMATFYSVVVFTALSVVRKRLAW